MARAKKSRPIGDVIDELGATRAQLAVLTNREASLKDELLSHRVGEGEGARYSYRLVSAARAVLDQPRLKLEFGADWFDARCKTVMTTSVRTMVRPEALAATATAEAA